MSGRTEAERAEAVAQLASLQLTVDALTAALDGLSRLVAEQQAHLAKSRALRPAVAKAHAEVKRLEALASEQQALLVWLEGAS